MITLASLQGLVALAWRPLSTPFKGFTSMATDKEKTAWGVASVFAITGLVLQLAADWLARKSIGPGAWTTDPDDVQNYQRIGAAIMVFGLVLLTVTFCRWLWRD